MFQTIGIGLLLMIILPSADFAWGQDLSQEIPSSKDFNWREKGITITSQLREQWQKGITVSKKIQENEEVQKVLVRVEEAAKKIPGKLFFLGEKLRESNIFVLRMIPAKDNEGKNKKTYIGIASHYGEGDGYNGKIMANGERMDKNKILAAHRKLPLGTLVKVTNLENGLSINTFIKDRGPYVKNWRGKFTREIDLSVKTAELLGFKEKGLALVEIIPLG